MTKVIEATDAAAYAALARAHNTERAYRADWAHFAAWCLANRHQPLPASPACLAAYLASLAQTHAPATIRRRLVALAQVHATVHATAHAASEPTPWAGADPTVRATLRGILRAHGRPPRRAHAITTRLIRQLVATCGTDTAGLRDRALLLIGYAGALRRAELAAIRRDHLVFEATGALRLLIPRSKTDATGEGAWLGIPRGERRDTCPVRALEAWLTASRTTYGPVFRRVDRWGGIDHEALQPAAIRQILTRHAAAAGLPMSPANRLSPHGLRAGFVTEAYQAGARDEAIMAHTRHRDLATMRAYVRAAELTSDSPAKLLGL